MLSTTALIIYGIGNLIAATLSGVSGAGGGFIATPLLVLLGLPPQNAIATGKLNGVSLSLGSLHRFTKHNKTNWQVVVPIMILAGVIGLIAPYFITKIDNDAYRTIMGVLLIAMIPILFIKKVGQSTNIVDGKSKVIGYIVLALTLLLQGVFSTGMGTFVNIALMVFLGMSATEAHITKRFSQLALNGLIVLGLIGTGLIVWQVVAVGVVTAFVGGQLGSHIAIKKGDTFVMVVFAGLMFLSGLALIFG